MILSRLSPLPIALSAVFLLQQSSLAQSAGSFGIDFRNATWTHPTASGGTVTQTGWAKEPSKTTGYTSGSTVFANGTRLDVTTRFFGTAKAGTDNFTFDAVNTNGFSFQNAGTGDVNGNDANGNVLLINYQRIDFSFSDRISMDFLRIGDIDTNSSSGTQTWRDTVAVGLWNVAPSVSPPATPGTLIDPVITFSNPTNLRKSTTSTGLDYVFADKIGNFTAPSPSPPNDPSTATFEYDSNFVSGFSIYFWNRGTGTGSSTKHAVVLEGNSFTPVPEPSTACLLALGLLAAIRRRR